MGVPQPRKSIAMIFGAMPEPGMVGDEITFTLDIEAIKKYVRNPAQRLRETRNGCIPYAIE
jgi:hypothetical protein